MNFYQSVLSTAFLIALASTGYFFFLGRNLGLARRVASAAHGALAVVVLPLVWVIQVKSLIPEPDIVAGLIVLLCGLSIGSIIYSVTVIRENGWVHLLHLATLSVNWANVSFGLLLTYGT